MDLKSFIKGTISSIVEATSELQEEFESEDVLLNPPVAQSGSDVYSPDSANYTYRKIGSVDFDVALTVSSVKDGQAGAEIKVFSAQIGAKGSKSSSTESVSRVQFSVPITLKPTKAESENQKKRLEKGRRDSSASRKPQNQSIA